MLSVSSSHIASSLTQLPCFNNETVQAIMPLLGGLSHEVYRVDCVSNRGIVDYKADGFEYQSNKRYVAKRVEKRETRFAEVVGAQKAFQLGLGPKVIYANEQWLISEFVDGTPLANVDMSITDKLSICLPLLSRLHQEPIELLDSEQHLGRLNVQNTIDVLLNHSCRPNSQKKVIADLVQEHYIDTSNLPLVHIHGDCNFTNILVNLKTNKERDINLIDFEATSLATAEFELGMLMAVNLIPEHEMKNGLKHYHTGTEIDDDIVTRNAILSCLINALWYEQQVKTYSRQYYQVKASQQYQLLEQLTGLKYSFISK